MLTIRLQRTGRSGHAQFRIVVQESRLSPTSGKIVTQVGHYNPHTKNVVVDSEKAGFYLENGAQPSPRVVSIFQKEGIKLPSWVEAPQSDKKKNIKNIEKLRRNRPADAAPPATEQPAQSAEEVEASAASETIEPVEAPAEEKSQEAAPLEEAVDEGGTAPASE